MQEEPGRRMFLVRHGQTGWSRAGRHTGLTDVALEAEGRSEATALAPRLSGHDFALVLTSPLVRATETAMLAGVDARAERIGDLSEWDYGDYEGLTTPEIRQGRAGWDLWAHGVPGGETAAEVGRRADRVIERARSIDGDTLCVAHGHVLRVLAARWLGLPPAGGRLFVLYPASISVLGWEREVPVIACWNERPPR